MEEVERVERTQCPLKGGDERPLNTRSDSVLGALTLWHRRETSPFLLEITRGRRPDDQAPVHMENSRP